MFQYCTFSRHRVNLHLYSWSVARFIIFFLAFRTCVRYTLHCACLMHMHCVLSSCLSIMKRTNSRSLTTSSPVTVVSGAVASPSSEAVNTVLNSGVDVCNALTNAPIPSQRPSLSPIAAVFLCSLTHCGQHPRFVDDTPFGVWEPPQKKNRFESDVSVFFNQFMEFLNSIDPAPAPLLRHPRLLVLVHFRRTPLLLQVGPRVPPRERRFPDGAREVPLRSRLPYTRFEVRLGSVELPHRECIPVGCFGV